MSPRGCDLRNPPLGFNRTSAVSRLRASLRQVQVLIELLYTGENVAILPFIYFPFNQVLVALFYPAMSRVELLHDEDFFFWLFPHRIL